MTRRRSRLSEANRPQRNSLRALGSARRFPGPLPQTAEECARWMEVLVEHQRVIMHRMKRVTLQLNKVLGKQVTASERCELTPSMDTVKKEGCESKTDSIARGDQTTDAVTDNVEEELDYENMTTLSAELCTPNAADYWEISPELTSPLICAIKKLQQRHDQKRGIKMWTTILAGLFCITDKDGSGYIDAQEYDQMLDMLDISEELKFSLRDKFYTIDKDNSGGISLTEFLMYFLRFPMFKEELTTNAKSNAPYVYERHLSGIQHWRQWLYCVVECPEYNFVSKILFCIDLILTSVPIVIFCAEGVKSSLHVIWPQHTFMWFVSIFFALEYFCGLMLCRYKKKFIFDIVHTFEFVSFVFWIYYNTLASSERIDPMGFVLFRIIRYVNLHKVFKLAALEEDLHIYVNTLKLAYTSSGAVLMLLVFSIFIFSLLMYVFERGIYDNQHAWWERAAGEGESPFADMSSCIYFVLVTMTTLGYGDMSPKSYVGMMVAMITVFVGLCNITFLINIVGDCFEEVFREFVLKKSKEMEKELSVYLTDCVQETQARSNSWMSFSKSSQLLRHVKVHATSNAKELS